MRHLHFDCFSGISGDMTLGALVDAGLSLKELVRALKDLPATGYRLRSRSVMRGHSKRVSIATAFVPHSTTHHE